MNNIANILKDAPKGTKLYTPILGEVTFLKVEENSNIWIYSKSKYTIIFDKYGRYIVSDNEDSECLLFPSKEVREWDNFTLKKEYEFKPFDKVIVRDDKFDTWTINFFSHKDKTCKEAPYATINGWYIYCLPYNEETAKLIGTTDDYNE